jgi:hypothetical protein
VAPQKRPSNQRGAFFFGFFFRIHFYAVNLQDKTLNTGGSDNENQKS